MQKSIKASGFALGLACFLALVFFSTLPDAYALNAAKVGASPSDPSYRLNLESQGAGTPNLIGGGVFVPLAFKPDRLSYLDFLVNINLGDYGTSSSIINTRVKGGTLSASLRAGYRWLNPQGSWMYGLYSGIDTRRMATGEADTGVDVWGSRSVTFKQYALGLETATDRFFLEAYALVPFGTTEYILNSVYDGGALNTYGASLGYRFENGVTGSLGYYHQHGDQRTADGAGQSASVSIDTSRQLQLALELTKDKAFGTQVSGKLIFYPGVQPTASAKGLLAKLITPPSQRNVRVHDATCLSWDQFGCNRWSVDPPPWPPDPGGPFCMGYGPIFVSLDVPAKMGCTYYCYCDGWHNCGGRCRY